MIHLMAVALIGAPVAQPVVPTAQAWATLASADLARIRELLETNHPGPVDPQNPKYRDWLERGHEAAKARAASAASYADYTRALRFYVNGFRDGHVAVSFALAASATSWPGFLVRRDDADGRVKVAVARAESEIPVGAELRSCDGRDVDALLADRVDPFVWNADLPHARWRGLAALFTLQPADTQLRLKDCAFVIDGVPRSVALRWRTDPRDVVQAELARLSPPPKPLGIERVDGVWFVRLPSFNYAGESAQQIAALVDRLREQSPELRRSIVVLDVRGNGGGNSAWGKRVAAALWSDALADRVETGFDWTVDWRVSADNIAYMERLVPQARRDGLEEVAVSRQKTLETLRAAQARGERLARQDGAPAKVDGAPPANPVTGHVFLLTDNACASACLDFADLVRRLPRATHVGLPTSADAVYIDNTGAPLPSGLASLSYSLKVYRNRVRANNQWYEPQLRWPGGEMTDAAVARWVTTLAAQAPRPPA